MLEGSLYQVYDCNCMDDQLILGIKGTISSVELKVLQTRLIAGMEEKAKRGKFKRQVPPGYIWDASDNVVKDPNCSNSLKKKIIRTIIEEVIVYFDEEDQRLNFVIHWKGGCHTEFEMPKPVSGVGRKTSLEDLEIIRGMAFRYGDDAIARVLNKLGRKSATGKRWNESRVRTIRGKYSIAGHIHTIKDPEILSLGQSAKYLDVSRTTIKRLAANGVLEKKQIVSWAPWEIKKSDLDSNHIRDIINTLNKTGRLGVKGNGSERQMYLFND